MPKGWYGESKRHSEAAKLGHQRKRLGLPPLYYEKLLEIHQQRQRRARMIDERLLAKDTLQQKEVYKDEDSYIAHSWAKDPGRRDIEGIDTPRGHAYYISKTKQQEFKNYLLHLMMQLQRLKTVQMQDSVKVRWICSLK